MAVYFSTFNYTFFPLLFEHTSPHFFFFLMRPCKLCSHLRWITKRDWVGQRLGCERSELGHCPAGCRHLWNSLLDTRIPSSTPPHRMAQWWPISFRVKAKILALALSHCYSHCPPPWPHFPALASPLRGCQLPYLHSPTPGPLHMPSSSSSSKYLALPLPQILRLSHQTSL